MNEDRDALRARWDQWSAKRQEISDSEDSGQHVQAYVWEASDDAAVDLLFDLAQHLGWQS